MLAGEKTIALVASDGAVSETGRKLSPPSVDFQMPPVAAPTKTTSALDGWMARAVILPATLPHDVPELAPQGPSGRHESPSPREPAVGPASGASGPHDTERVGSLRDLPSSS